MQLITPLVSGFAGASSGTYEVYEHGTTTAATVYSDFDGETVITSLDLDANGSAVAYVSGVVDVVVKDVDDATVATFTVAESAASVEVRNGGFTGTLTSGGTGAGGRTSLDEVLTSIYASFGAKDGEVLFAGAATPLKTALAGLEGSETYSVTAYGAVGDDSTDDTLAIQTAIDACGAAGGGTVTFPNGTFKITSVLSNPYDGVRLEGMAGPFKCIIKQYSTTADSLNISGTMSHVIDIGFSYDDTNSTGKSVVFAATAVQCHTDSCRFFGHNGVAVYFTNGCIGCEVDDCEMYITKMGGVAVWGEPGVCALQTPFSGGGKGNLVRDSKIYTTASMTTTYSPVVFGLVRDCLISGAGNGYCLDPIQTMTGDYIMYQNNRFSGPFAGGTVSTALGYKLPVITANGLVPAYYLAKGNMFRAGSSVYNCGTAGGWHTSGALSGFVALESDRLDGVNSFYGLTAYTGSDIAGGQGPLNQYRSHFFQWNSKAVNAAELRNDGIALPGWRQTYHIHNGHTATLTVTMGTTGHATTMMTNSGVFLVPRGQTLTMNLVYGPVYTAQDGSTVDTFISGGRNKWCPVGPVWISTTSGGVTAL